MAIPMTPAALDAALAEATQLRASWQLDAAEDAYRALLPIEPLRPRLLTEIAITLAHQGLGAEALAAVEEAERLAPDDATVAQNRLILEKLREPEDPEQFLALHRRYGERFVATRGELCRRMPPRQPGPLRIAYLGVDAHTALARFVPMLATHHDRTRFHAAFFYGASDEATIGEARRRLPQVAHVSVRDLDPHRLAVSLAHGGVDIAVDLIGHGHGCVLEALAWRPAPLQVTWLDYVATTGVAAITARLCDRWTDPPDATAWCSEQALRLDLPQWCAQAPQPAPARRSGGAPGPLLGIVNATNKASPRLYHVAARVLSEVAEARLRVIGVAGERARHAARGALRRCAATAHRLGRSGIRSRLPRARRRHRCRARPAGVQRRNHHPRLPARWPARAHLPRTAAAHALELRDPGAPRSRRTDRCRRRGSGRTRRRIAA
jgi:protein O-GlcNAc transferase